tara:strand:- start:44 stop:736 length:693 start_codon:yes stop_codon:yes gene_type:complete
MATSGSTSFDLDIDEIIQEGYERCGLNTNSGYDLKTARRSLNILFSEWGNRGVHLWKVVLNSVPMVNGTTEYTAPSNCSVILEAYISSTDALASDTQDVALSKISRSEYSAIPNKGSVGQPSQYYVSRVQPPIVSLYQTPNASTYTHLKYYYVKKLEDATAYSGQQADVVYRFQPAMCAGLAYYLAQKKTPEKVEMLKIIYEDEMRRALVEDGQRTSVYITPKDYFPAGI